MSILEDLQRTFRWADAADIAFVSVFLYALFVWFKSTASRQILVGMSVLVVVYLTSLAFDMYLTAGLFQAALAFVAIAVIVIFQEDLRRAFVRVASLGRLPRFLSEQTAGDFDIIVEVAFELARKRVGSLIVLRDAEPLERHVSGGVIVDARMSKALLDSIFDPHSMGHDGAVIIENGRVKQFGARLPLSQNSEEIGARGTRHSAALGLAELSDALVIVVSEERGEVSIAEHGKLVRVTTPVELKKSLERFTQQGQAPKGKGLRRQILIENPGLKFLAIVSACIWWFLVSFEAETVQKTFAVPIEYRNLPNNLVLDIDETRNADARVTLSGYERAFNLLAPSTLKVSVDLGKVKEGRNQEIVIDESHVKLPSNLTLFRCRPRMVEFSVEEWVPAQLAVEPRIEGRLPNQRIIVIPETVRVLIWRSARSWTTKIETEAIDLSQVSQATELKTKLVLREHMRFETDQVPDVRIKVDFIAENENATNAKP